MKGFPKGYGVVVRDLWSHKDIALIEEAHFNLTQANPLWGGGLFKFTWVPISSEALPIYDTPGDPHSAITLDPTIVPRNHSTIPGYEKYVEQCGEVSS